MSLATYAAGHENAVLIEREAKHRDLLAQLSNRTSLVAMARVAPPSAPRTLTAIVTGTG